MPSNRDSLDTAASFTNERYVAYIEVLSLIANYEKEDKERTEAGLT